MFKLIQQKIITYQSKKQNVTDNLTQDIDPVMGFSISDQVRKKLVSHINFNPVKIIFFTSFSLWVETDLRCTTLPK